MLERCCRQHPLVPVFVSLFRVFLWSDRLPLPVSLLSQFSPPNPSIRTYTVVTNQVRVSPCQSFLSVCTVSRFPIPSGAPPQHFPNLFRQVQSLMPPALFQLCHRVIKSTSPRVFHQRSNSNYLGA